MVYKSTCKKLNDRQLWNSIRHEDRNCHSMLFNRYYPRLYSYGLNIVQCDEFVKDCIQELFLTIWEQRETVSSVYSVKAYLFVSMRRMIFYNLRKVRKQKNRNIVFAKEFETEIPHVENRIIHKEFEKEFNIQLEEALNNLSNRQKEIIKLKYIEGLSSSEIANLLQINRQSVYNHVSEALKQLKYLVNNSSKPGGSDSPVHNFQSLPV